ncbi:MAG: hypothetical protein M3P06_24825 [Acidobacteriota bacterium]|nr:hypothetical protein [Acidobacteriota bacterium]
MNTRNMNWVKHAPLSEVALQQAIAEATVAETDGPRPIALLETNYYTYLPSEQLQLRLTVAANGFGAPVTLYLFHENRTTGERRYYNVAGGLQNAGVTTDLFGSVGSPAPVFVPALSDFVLFGSASDASALSWGINGALGGNQAAGAIGLYQWGIELRDAAGKRILARSNAAYSNIATSIPVSGTITSSTTWTANNRYSMNEFVGVVAPAVLTIEPGTVIYGGSTRATLFIQRGAKIIADGTSRRPIVFTSPQRVGSRAQQDWGSLVLLGSAPLNVTGGTAILEGLPSDPAYTYGGQNAADSSGIVRYVRLEFGGFPIATNQEINGLTLGGVGNGTVLDYIQVLHNKDDGFEFFGGTVNASHLLGIDIADDALDFDFGYSGSVQFAAFIKRGGYDENDSNIFTESDNNGSGGAELPLTSARVYNVTSVRATNAAGAYGGVLRRNTAGKFYNSIIAGTRLAPITIRDNSTFTNAASGALVVDNSILFGSFADSAFPNTSDRASQTRDFLFTTMKNNRNVDPKLAIGTVTLVETLAPDLTPLSDSPALDAGYLANPPDDGFLKAVDFIGAVGPGNNWVLSGWANFSDN